jgi:hypothetical protein
MATHGLKRQDNDLLVIDSQAAAEITSAIGGTINGAAAKP